jgi:hypothetical protein
VRLRPAEQDGVAVRRCAHDGNGTERGTAAANVLDHDRAEMGLQLVRQWAADEVVGTARWKGNDQPDRSRRIILRPRDARNHRHGGSARGPVQECAARKLHDWTSTLVDQET